MKSHRQLYYRINSLVRYGTTILKPKAEIICRNAPLTRKRCVTLTLKRTPPTHFLHEVSQAIILQNQQPSNTPYQLRRIKGKGEKEGKIHTLALIDVNSS